MSDQFVDDGGPVILDLMRGDPQATVEVHPSNPAHGKSGQAAAPLVAYVDGLRAELRRLQPQADPLTWVSWLTDAERRYFAAQAHSRMQMLDDPRYWADVFPPPAEAFGPDARAARRVRQARWARIAAVLDPELYAAQEVPR